MSITKKTHHKKEYRHNREVVLWLHAYKCYINKTHNGALEVHHIDKNALNNSLQNLVPLCKSCHSMAHKTNLKITIDKYSMLNLLLRKVNEVLGKK